MSAEYLFRIQSYETWADPVSDDGHPLTSSRLVPSVDSNGKVHPVYLPFLDPISGAPKCSLPTRAKSPALPVMRWRFMRSLKQSLKHFVSRDSRRVSNKGRAGRSIIPFSTVFGLAELRRNML
jgi:hypothetical protein